MAIVDDLVILVMAPEDRTLGMAYLTIRVEDDLGILVMAPEDPTLGMADRTMEMTQAPQLHRRAASRTARVAMAVAVRSATSSSS